MARYIPERTVDSLLAIEIARHDPHALIWSPSNTAGSIDHEVLGGPRVVLFECKAVDMTAKGRWTAPVPSAQLKAYLTQTAVYYVFLGRPADPDAPHKRVPCAACGGSWCRACCRDARSWSLLAPHVSRANQRLRLQPWFCHWAWVVEADDLDNHLGGHPPPTTWSLSLHDDDMAAIIGAERLCHFLHRPLASRGVALSDGDLDRLLSVPAQDRDDEDETPPVFVVSEDTAPPA